MPVRFAVVHGAGAQRVVRRQDPSVVPLFVQAAQGLVSSGARAITTTCGFMARWQRELQAALPVPVWSSSLLCLPHLPRPGVITIDAASLDTTVLQGVGADPRTPVAGLEPGCSLQRTLLEDGTTLDAVDARAQMLAAAQDLVRRYPDVSDIVFECANMPPYAAAVQAATGRRVHHLISVVDQAWAAQISISGEPFP